MNNPAPSEIKSKRKEAHLTQSQAADLVYVILNTWQKWEAGDRKMHPAFWELFNLKKDKAAR